MTTPKIEDYRAVDQFDITESVFEVEEGSGRLMANVRIIKSGLSKNRRNYRPSALKESVNKGLWDGVRMFSNHSKLPPLQRPFEEMVAAIESTSYHEKDQAVDARVEFFDQTYYDKARRAQRYMGDSINAMVQGTRVKDRNGQVTEDIHHIVQPRSVDFVIYPSAGGMIHSFEGEGAMIDWDQITAAQIKENAAAVYEAIKAEVVAEQPKPDPAKEKPVDPKPVVGLTQEEVDSQIQAALTKHEEEATETRKKIAGVQEKLIEAFSKSGLPEPTKRRLSTAFEGQTEYDEAKVTSAITLAKEELAAAGAGPRITGQGPSDGSSGAKETKNFSAHESVSAAFGIKPKAPAKEGDK
jgi:hypothetical protein